MEGLVKIMIKCCQNCHWFRKAGSVCESGEITVDADDLMETPEIRYILEAENVCCKVQIKDPQNFCCNAWR